MHREYDHSLGVWLQWRDVACARSLYVYVTRRVASHHAAENGWQPARERYIFLPTKRWIMTSLEQSALCEAHEDVRIMDADASSAPRFRAEAA